MKNFNLTDPKLRMAIYLAHDKRCFYTGRKLEFNNIDIDHIIPKSKGGKNILENYVLCDPNINKIKSDSFNESDKNLFERMVFINKICFIDKVIKNYNNLFFKKEEFDGDIIKNKINIKMGKFS